MIKSLSEKTILLLIILVSILSLGGISRLYFSYEDLAFFYSFQFPGYSEAIRNNAYLYKHPAAYWLIEPMFEYFDYEPIGYYSITLVLFIIFNFIFYRLLKSLSNKKLALMATLIQASTYVGIDGFIWNMAVGPEIMVFLIFTLITFFVLSEYLKNHNNFILLALLLLYSFTVYNFPFRSFFLFSWIPLFVFFTPNKNKIKTLIFSFTLTLFGIVLVSKYMNRFEDNIMFVNISIPYLIKIFIEDLSYLFPFYNLMLPSLRTIKGVSVLILLLISPFLLNTKMRNTAFFFSFSLLSSLVLMMAATQFTGQVALTWESNHWYYLTMLPMLAGFLGALFIGIEQKNKKFNSIIATTIVVVVNTVLTNKAVSYRLQNHSDPLRYFYTTLPKLVPKITKNDAIVLNINGGPRALNPFISGIGFDGTVYLAGLYNIKFDDLNYAFGPMNAVKLLVDKNIQLDRTYSLDYIQNDLRNETVEFRTLLKTGKITSLGKFQKGQSIEISNLNLSTITPLFLKLSVSNLPNSLTFTQPAEVDNKYLDVYFSQNTKRKLYKVSTNVVGDTPEHQYDNIIDGKVDTAWVAESWPNDGVEITLDLGKVRRINKIIWASARTSPWFLRSVSDYTILISKDGQNFQTAKENHSSKYLERNEYFVEEISTAEAKIIKLKILKTHGGLAPAIDELEVFEESEVIPDIEKYFEVRANITKYLDSKMLQKYLSEVLENKIPVTLFWKNEYNAEYGGDNSKIFNIRANEKGEYLVFLPRTGREVRSLKLVSERYPTQLTVASIEAWYPALDDFRSNKTLLNNQ